MEITDSRDDVEIFLRQIGYQVETSEKFYKLKEELEKNGADYSNEIFKIIDEIVIDKEKHQFIKELPVGTRLYRAREIKVEEYSKQGIGIDIKCENGELITEGFDEKNSIECPIGRGGDGRNNIAGASYLYVAEDVATACAEIKTTLRSLISVAEFEVKAPLSIIDFSNDDKKFTYTRNDEYQLSLGRFITLLMLQYCQPATKREDYKVTQMISDYIRKMGFDGILYRSFFTMKNNYTVFNCHKSKITFLNSRIVSHQFSDNIFWDFNNKVAIHTEQHESVEYEQKTANVILLSMKKEFDDRKKRNMKRS